jgi:SulP family sulfate permease
MSGTKHDSNQELIGQGLANLGSALFGGFAATGAIARTATNVRHGGTSPVAGLVHSATILLVLLVLAPLAFSVPLTTLAAVLFVVAYNMSDVGRLVRTVRRAPRSDVAVMLVTLGLTVFTDLVVAVEVGVILAMLNFFRRMTAAVEVRAVADDEVVEHSGEEGVVIPAGVLVYSIDGPFFFGAVEQFESALVHTGTDPDAVVLSFAHVPFIDLTGLAALRDAVERLEKRGVPLALCCANAEVAGKLERAAIAGTTGTPATAGLRESIEALAPRATD